MKTRIYVGRDEIGRFNCDGRTYTRLQIFKMKTIRLIKRVVLVSAGMSALGWAFVAGSNYLPHVVHADQVVTKTITVAVPADVQFPPILQKICNAESGGRQFLANGNVLRGKIDPSDIGYCQINEPTWNDKARQLGYDIFTEQGNKDMALWIFTNYGDQPWSASKPQWSK